ncbi:hypothetical protein TNCV_4005741 [Trichonephila clavipes]|nr:hypothetical protein TNCV_4005741 [Trichonephila clavipes]
MAPQLAPDFGAVSRRRISMQTVCRRLAKTDLPFDVQKVERKPDKAFCRIRHNVLFCTRMYFLGLPVVLIMVLLDKLLLQLFITPSSLGLHLR